MGSEMCIRDRVSVSCKYYTGNLVCAVLDSPVSDLIIGNIPGIDDTDRPTNGQTVCAVTRLQARKQIPQLPLVDVTTQLNVTKDDLTTH